MRNLIIFLLLFSVGCKPKKEYIYRDTVIDNTEIQHTKETIFKGSKVTTIIPCKEVDQVVDLGNTKIKIKSVPIDTRIDTLSTSEGSIIMTINQDDFISVDTTKVSERVETYNEKSKEIVYEKYIPKWMWYLLIASVLLNIWSYRKPILLLLRKLLIKV